MKKIKQHYPRRGAMLDAPFEPLSDEDFRRFVASGAASPTQKGGALIVTKWQDGPHMGADEFLQRLHAEGSSLAVRDFHADVNIRVIRAARASARSEGVSRVPKSRS